MEMNMAINFNTSDNKQSVTEIEATEIMEAEQYDIVADRQRMNQVLIDSSEVDELVSTIELDNLETIVTFGAKAAEEIAKASDIVLKSMNMSQLDDSTKILNVLANVMSKFDIEEINENPSFFGKLFGGFRKQLDKMLAKYHTMGEEVDKIYIQLKQYESEIKKSNRNLNQLFEANVNYYQELVRYILAGEQGCKEINTYLEQRKQEFKMTGDNAIQFDSSRYFDF